MVATDTARGLLMPMPTTAMAGMEDMAAMVDTDMARGPLMPMPTTAMAAMEAMAAMAVMAVAMDTAMASNSFKSVTICQLSVPFMILIQTVQNCIMTIVIFCDTH